MSISEEFPVTAIEVRIPTILRSYTDGAKSVEGSGSTLNELFADPKKAKTDSFTLSEVAF